MRRRRRKQQPQDAMRDLFLQENIKAEVARLDTQRREDHGNPIGQMMGELERLRQAAPNGPSAAPGPQTEHPEPGRRSL